MSGFNVNAARARRLEALGGAWTFGSTTMSSSLRSLRAVTRVSSVGTGDADTDDEHPDAAETGEEGREMPDAAALHRFFV